MSEGKYQIWSRYGFEDEWLIGSTDDLADAIDVADIESAWGTPDVRVWEELESGEMRQAATTAEELLEDGHLIDEW